MLKSLHLIWDKCILEEKFFLRRPIMAMSGVSVGSSIKNGMWFARASATFLHKDGSKEECAGESQNQNKEVAEAEAKKCLEDNSRYQALLGRR